MAALMVMITWQWRLIVCRGVYDDPTYGTVLYYAYTNTSIGYADDEKQFGWNVIDWSTGWPVV